MGCRPFVAGACCRGTAIVALLVCSLAQPAAAQPPASGLLLPHGQLAASDGTAVSGPVALHRNTAVVGAAGRAHIFRRRAGDDGWVHDVTTTPYDGGPGFGVSVATNGRYVVVGATGAAYVFLRRVYAWEQVARLVSPDGAASFGASVAISGRRIVVGAPAPATPGTRAPGAAYVFERVGDPYTWTLASTLRGVAPPGSATSDLFGASVAIDRATVVVGAVANFGIPSNTSRAHVFERNQGGPGAWGRVASLAVQGGAFDALPGIVSISRDTIVIGSENNSRVLIFERNQGGPDAWGQVAEPVPAAGRSASYGSRVDVSGDVAIISAPLEAGPFNAVHYLFARNQGGAGNWGEVARVAVQRPSTAAAVSNAIDGDTILAGGLLTAFALDTDRDLVRDRRDACPRDPLNNETGRCRRNSSATPLVDDLLTLDEVTTDTSGRRFRVRATLVNSGSTAIGNPFFEVTELDGGHVLLNADEGRGGVGATLSPDVGDGVLSPGEAVTATFVIRLNAPDAFRFNVVVRGNLTP